MCPFDGRTVIQDFSVIPEANHCKIPAMAMRVNGSGEENQCYTPLHLTNMHHWDEKSPAITFSLHEWRKADSLILSRSIRDEKKLGSLAGSSSGTRTADGALAAPVKEPIEPTLLVYGCSFFLRKGLRILIVHDPLSSW